MWYSASRLKIVSSEWADPPLPPGIPARGKPSVELAIAWGKLDDPARHDARERIGQGVRCLRIETAVVRHWPTSPHFGVRRSGLSQSRGRLSRSPAIGRPARERHGRRSAATRRCGPRRLSGGTAEAGHLRPASDADPILPMSHRFTRRREMFNAESRNRAGSGQPERGGLRRRAAVRFPTLPNPLPWDSREAGARRHSRTDSRPGDRRRWSRTWRRASPDIRTAGGACSAFRRAPCR